VPFAEDLEERTATNLRLRRAESAYLLYLILDTLVGHHARELDEVEDRVEHLEALLLVSDKDQTFLLSGQGDVIEPDGGIAAIGSGGPYAQAAAQALADHTKMSAREIAEEAMKIAGKMCIYTNEKATIEEL